MYVITYEIIKLKKKTKLLFTKIERLCYSLTYIDILHFRNKLELNKCVTLI